MQLNINQIKTIYSVFKVIYQKKVMFNGKEVAGVCSHRRHLIKLSTSQSIQSQIQSLEHEKLHAILEELKIDFDNEKEVDTLSCALVKFIQENPEFIKLILEEGGKSAI